LVHEYRCYLEKIKFTSYNLRYSSEYQLFFFFLLPQRERGIFDNLSGNIFFYNISNLTCSENSKKIGFSISPPRFPLLSFLREGRRKCEIKNIKI